MLVWLALSEFSSPDRTGIDRQSVVLTLKCATSEETNSAQNTIAERRPSTLRNTLRGSLSLTTDHVMRYGHVMRGFFFFTQALPNTFLVGPLHVPPSY